ncbi:cyclic GMP-AMP synthase-like receptor [Acropora muricata]|uniref:cyclic GMP-AMP synthase-like receptor n=1 Tax=Acropora muricata TaxID=159855 RepID=UPI0034E613DB
MALCLRNHVVLATSNTLDLFLSDLDERKGRISCSREVNLIQSCVRKVIRSILLEVRRENPFFTTRLINSGSFYEGTKVGQPDEFDFFILLDSFSSAGDTLFEELPCCTVAVVPGESAFENLCFYFTDCRDMFYVFEWKKTIKTPFCKLFNEKAKGFEAYGMKVVLPYEGDNSLTCPQPLARHGPAYTLQLEWSGGEEYKGLKISVDLTLAVKINSRPNKIDLEFESATGRVLKSVFDSVPYFFAVGSYRDVLTEVQPNYFAEYTSSGVRPINVCLRCSQSCFEQQLFCHEFGSDSGQSRCLRLLKVLRDIAFPDVEKEANPNNNSGFWLFFVERAADPLKKIGKLISSYVLKTLVLFEWQENPAEELWSGTNLSQRLVSILRSLVACLKQKKLRSFFYADYNIFPSSTTTDKDFLNAASMVSILLDGLLSLIRNINGCSFEECMEKIKSDFAIVYRKYSFTSLLRTGLWDTFFYDSYLEKAVKESLRKKGMGEIYSHEYMKSEQVLGAMKGIKEGDEKRYFFDVYIQALLDEIAPEETLILTSTNVKDADSIGQVGQLFKEMSRQTMTRNSNSLPNYSLWCQEHWKLDGSVYKYTTDEPKKLLNFLFDHFQEDVKILLHELN